MQTEPRLMNPLVLAYLGDAVFELFVRERVLSCAKSAKADYLHKEGVRYVNAYAQAKALDGIVASGKLTAEEISLVGRARNHKIATKAKNTDPMTYKKATAFEALLGYLYLSGRTERLNEIMEEAL